MTPLEIFAAAGLAAVVIAILHIATTREETGSSVIAATLCGLFLGYSLVTVISDGVMPVWVNHTTNMWGVQVWWDLLFAVGIATFFIVPRARAQGMNVPLWLLFVVSTASIGLLAMVARLFWLEKRTTS
ncbi:hypothetical protein [Qipengyuania qiaonensis]|uniref:DUF2834 domain-containing protein n=1 Tax=Qipengyuania qiaonensis TaxID=2867240 RepID=A0ABS7J5M9_9SPHN|nr:hypothetical protein [Qipengyuania qiaonensis]MBX7482633.1 hypothetical protein [Qipengyuania qiaonensis]